MPEWGNLQIPKKLLKAGVRDMVRLSDARMSGTHYGTCVLHIAPESAVGGPLALVRDGDPVTLDVPARRLSLDIDAAELERRRAAWTPPDHSADRGWVAIHRREVTQAPEGCDFPLMAGGRDQPEPEIY
jgi:dihydroxy-acid dehydratase